MTQSEIARRIGCASSTLEKIEQGVLRPSHQIAGLLAERLELPPSKHAAFVQWARMAQSRPVPVSLPLLATVSDNGVDALDGLASLLEGFAQIASGLGQPERAARLFGAVSVLRTSIEPTLSAARAQLDEAAWAQAWSEGEAMSWKDAVGYALQVVTK